jgi:hypothetical protein
MHKLISGIVEFREQHLPRHAERFRELVLAKVGGDGFLGKSQKTVRIIDKDCGPNFAGRYRTK